MFFINVSCGNIVLLPATFKAFCASVHVNLKMSGPTNGNIEPIYAEIGKRLQRARRRAALTQATVAERTSLSRTSIANIERGEQRFMTHCLYELAAALNVPVERLLPQAAGDQATRVETAIGGMKSDPKAAEFVKAGLTKAKVLSK